MGRWVNAEWYGEVMRIRSSVAIVAVGLVLAGACARKPQPRWALDFTLKDMAGKDVRLADYKGRPIVVNFWATWCGPCKAEMPDLIALADKHKAEKLAVLGISVDDTPEELRAFAREFKVTYPLLVGRDRDDVAAAFGWAGSVPMTVFVRSDGTISRTAEGPLGMYSKDWIDQQLRALF
jgi:peroxiredoxin